MDNKFLKLYPSLKLPKTGDKVKMVTKRFNIPTKNHILWDIGDTGIIEIIDTNKRNYLINFNNQENNRLYFGGKWIAQIRDFIII